jgi:RNA polymerase sigma-70 factor (ECF subfamily)
MEAMQIALAEAPNQEWSLVRQALSGDLDSFEELYREHSGRVYALCLRMSGDPAHAKDLTQDTFLRVWERMGTFRGESKFSSWLHRLAVNVVLSDRRSRGRRAAEVASVEELFPAKHPSSKPAAGRGRDLEKAITVLPTEARRVLVLHDIEGYKHEEIAKLTGRSVGTCKSQLHRARKLMREALRR